MKAKLKTEIKNLIFDQTRVEFDALTRKKNVLEAYIHCGITSGHCFTVILYTGRGYRFHCTNCEFEYFRPEDTLTEKEAKLVAMVFPTQKKKKV